MKILNLSNHVLTTEQVKELKEKGYAEIIELREDHKKLWGQLNPSNYKTISDDILQAYTYDAIHLAGFLPATVYVALKATVHCLYAYSPRVCVETPMPDKTISKQYIFKHLGFYKY